MLPPGEVGRYYNASILALLTPSRIRSLTMSKTSISFLENYMSISLVFDTCNFMLCVCGPGRHSISNGKLEFLVTGCWQTSHVRVSSTK